LICEKYVVRVEADDLSTSYPMASGFGVTDNKLSVPLPAREFHVTDCHCDEHVKCGLLENVRCRVIWLVVRNVSKS
jgi:hypothetical protein